MNNIFKPCFGGFRGTVHNILVFSMRISSGSEFINTVGTTFFT